MSCSKGVQSAELDVRSSQVAVRGMFEPARLVEQVYRRTGHHAVLVKAEPVEKPAGDEAEGGNTGGGDGEEGEKGDPPGGGESQEADAAPNGGGKGEKEGEEAGEVTKNHPSYYHFYYPRYQVEYAYPPQIFSDENPNACYVM